MNPSMHFYFYLRPGGRYLWQKIRNWMHLGNGSYPAKEETFAYFDPISNFFFQFAFSAPFFAVYIDLFQRSRNICFHLKENMFVIVMNLLYFFGWKSSLFWVLLKIITSQLLQLKGIVHNFFLYRSNLIFWIVMGCGIADFGRPKLSIFGFSFCPQGPWLAAP